MSKGLLISIEGPDGAGKTSVLKVLLPRLREVYPAQVITTREPEIGRASCRERV